MLKWTLVSVGAIIAGLVSALVWSNTVLTIICLIVLLISAYMGDESNIKANGKRKALIEKYYDTYGDRLLQSDELLKKLAKEIAKEVGYIGPINQKQIDILTFDIRSFKYKK